jgi:hypothetical protein
MDPLSKSPAMRVPWNKGKLVGQKAPLKQRELSGTLSKTGRRSVRIDA